MHDGLLRLVNRDFELILFLLCLNAHFFNDLCALIDDINVVKGFYFAGGLFYNAAPTCLTTNAQRFFVYMHLVVPLNLLLFRFRILTPLVQLLTNFICFLLHRVENLFHLAAEMLHLG